MSDRRIFMPAAAQARRPTQPAQACRSSRQLRPRRACAARACAATLAALAALAGCAAGVTEERARADVRWDYAPDALRIDIDASPRLNEYLNAPHTLLLAVFQSADARTFRQLADDPDRLRMTLAAGGPATDFIQTTRYVVEPGARVALSIDRAQQVRYVGIVAGYYDADGPRAARLFDVPLRIDKRGWFSSTYRAAPRTLGLKLRLGAQSITDAREAPLDLPPPGARAWTTLDGGAKTLTLPAGDANGSENGGGGDENDSSAHAPRKR
ncbi:type VI secretion system lipoprotein TssJ [Burkholderia thailandensis]|uniref:type VI secretion system lipoprotein TssJ n=1 Tax=Burkholderia thailandensis TaxID=57975 RepID=UPI0022AC4319|nr:type VI secretion system lipoprotein TssJ [Burkholderia thailandensis]MCZ2901841.1 type VI secretion system lipoprotein TssJ [Burkholderia thailandensis]MDD1480403.1 type VI secretion system lipoprotein TssJ [Burkholderia thailandensis]MDD1485391.1 type VI secretion system lipoprotein TssJ [Burkholderia thailandensis]MDD1494378.1 type VI secretion system lipoprotein TssJ [Burkholderia thailandensis]